MTGHSTLYGLVLAGGRSSRMGQDKAQLNWYGRPLYQHMMALLTRAGIDHVLVSGSGFETCKAYPENAAGAEELARNNSDISESRNSVRPEPVEGRVLRPRLSCQSSFDSAQDERRPSLKCRNYLRIISESPVESIEDIFPGRGPLSGIHATFRQLQDGDRLLVIPVDMPLVPVAAIRMLCGQQQACCFEGFNLPVILPVSSDSRQVIEQAIQSDNPKDYALWRLFQRLEGETMPLPAAMADDFENANTPEDWRHLITRHS